MAVRKSTDGCVDVIRATKVKVEEKRKSAVFLNAGRERVRLIKVDVCLVVGELAADWLVSHPQQGDVIVELKGSDLAHALKQAVATAQMWYGHDLRRSGAKLVVLIVCAQIPKVQFQVAKTTSELATLCA